MEEVEAHVDSTSDLSDCGRNRGVAGRDGGWITVGDLLLWDETDAYYSLGAIYTAGYFRMSTWIPFVWAMISVFIIILSSISIQGGL